MSKEQWGHGYWKGVEDAQSGVVKLSFPDEVKWWIYNMCISNWDKDYDRSLFPVSEFIHYAAFCGLSTEYAKKVYDYVYKRGAVNVFGQECYISGDSHAPWNEDYYVIPLWAKNSKEEWQNEADALIRKIQETKETVASA